MKKDEIRRDDLIGKLIQNSASEEPSEGFINEVMEKIRLAPKFVPLKRNYFSVVKATIPYLIVTFILVLIVFTSDFPFLNNLLDNYLLTITYIRYIELLSASLKNIFSSAYVTFGLMIGVSVFFLFLIDLIFSRKNIFHHHDLV